VASESLLELDRFNINDALKRGCAEMRGEKLTLNGESTGYPLRKDENVIQF
jgi:hypothetical protein